MSSISRCWTSLPSRYSILTLICPGGFDAIAHRCPAELRDIHPPPCGTPEQFVVFFSDRCSPTVQIEFGIVIEQRSKCIEAARFVRRKKRDNNSLDLAILGRPHADLL
jgi:hypothetical protein